jgi:hypothetical protein
MFIGSGARPVLTMWDPYISQPYGPPRPVMGGALLALLFCVLRIREFFLSPRHLDRLRGQPTFIGVGGL